MNSESGNHGQSTVACPRVREHGTRMLWLLGILLLSGCQGYHSSLDPAGPMSGQIYHVIHIFLWVSVVVYVLVVIALILAILRMRFRVDLRNDPIFIPGAESNRQIGRAHV